LADIGRGVRERRVAVGLTQDALAERAQVSRALVGALERGRHMPATDAAIRLARALDTTVERLFGDAPPEPLLDVSPVLGDHLPDGALVRTARVERAVVARVVDPASALSSTGASADGVMRDGRLRLFTGAAPSGAVVAGCDPVLGIAEGLLEHAGHARIVAVGATSGQALEALEAGRCHAVLVHGPAGSLRARDGLQRWHVARWRSGIATHRQLSRPSLQSLLADEVPILVQRDRTAACQQAVERAARRLGTPRVTARRMAGGHLDAARLAAEHHAAAVTIEPFAIAFGLDFCELEVHDVELWVPDAWTGLAGICALLELLHTASFRDRAGALPAYDLTDTGAAR
jgi:transcriptional regulator with XRE-family HTH domain